MKVQETVLLMEFRVFEADGYSTEMYGLQARK